QTATTSEDTQIQTKTSFQIGDGTTPTYLNNSSIATALPSGYAPTINRRFWQVPEEAVSIRINASANDTINLTACLLTSPTRQIFEIVPSSSTDAAYDFTGMVLSG